MIRRPIKRRLSVLISASSIVLFLAGYTVLSHIQHSKNEKDTTIPTWSQLKDGVSNFCVKDRKGERWIAVDAKATGSRLFYGLGLGVMAAVLIGVWAGCYPKVEAFFVPILSLLSKIPPTAALAVFFVMLGTDTNMYVGMIAFGVLPTLAQAVYLGVKDVPEELLFKAETLGASNAELVWNVVVRYIAPKLVDAIRLQIGPAMVYLIAAEMVVGHEGFGYRIRLQSKLLNMNVVYPYLAILAMFGYGIDYTLRAIKAKLFPWYENGRS